MFFIRLFSVITWKKKLGSPCLFPHKLPSRVGMVLRSQSGWRICAAGFGTRYKIKPILFGVRTRDQACFRLFLCVWYRQHRNSYLDRVQQMPWKEVSQDFMRFWRYESIFWTVLYRWRSVFLQQCLTKKLKEKTVDRFLCFICSLVWFLYTAKCKFSRKLRVYIKERSSSRGSGVTAGLTYLFDKYSSLHARTLNNMCTVAILGQTLSR